MTEKEKFVELTIQAPSRIPEEEKRPKEKTTKVTFEINQDVSFDINDSCLIDFNI